MFLRLPVLLDGVEVRQRVPDARRLRALLDGFADHRVVLAVRLGAAEDVVTPADVTLVQQIREIGPRVVRGDTLASGRIRWCAGVLQRVDTAHRIVRARAAGRPLGDQEQMRRKTPGGVRLVEVVLEDEVPGIRPVVRDVAPIVVAHDIGIRRALGADRVVGVLLASPAPARPPPERRSRSSCPR